MLVFNSHCVPFLIVFFALFGWLGYYEKAKKYMLDFLNFLAAKYDVLKFWKKNVSAVTTRESAGPIALISKNGIMRQSRGTIHTLDVKNWFTLKWVSSDFLEQFCITRNSLQREPIFNIQRMNCSPRLAHYSISLTVWPQIDRSSQPFSSQSVKTLKKIIFCLKKFNKSKIFFFVNFISQATQKVQKPHPIKNGLVKI
jgi:hypothetical protein